jgi:hypothetical protein
MPAPVPEIIPTSPTKSINKTTIAAAILHLLQSGNIRPTSADIENAIKMTANSNPNHV